MPDVALRADVAVVGSGPAGLALAVALRGTGVDVVLVAPSPHASWTATYATWVDDLAGRTVGGVTVDRFSTVWDDVEVRVGAGSDSLRVLSRPYATLDAAGLQAALLAALTASAGDGAGHGGRIEEGTVESITHHVDGDGRRTSRLHVRRDGRPGPVIVECRLVIDARGARPAAAAQVAHGVVVRAEEVRDTLRDGVLPASGRCVLMDWTQPRGHDDGSGAPTFLYALPGADGTILLEETSLVAEPPLDGRILRDRLGARLGVDLTDVAAHIETVTIPMAPRPPRAGGAVVPFGAAAGYVHPATGYSVAASLRAAPRVAAAVADALARDPDGRADIGAVAWRAVWPAEQRRVRALQGIGLRALLRMDAAATARFFDVFFALPVEVWAPFLRVDATPAETSAAMRAVFRASDAGLRLRLAAAGVR